jgi:deoxyribonuclease (pyrimidine dimer)
MVRINLVNPKNLSDQHLIAEYNEILMLVSYVRKFPNINGIPENYLLGKGHIKFFKNKLGYLSERHEELKKEMGKRNFVCNKSLDVKSFGKEYFCDWKPSEKDFEIIKQRIVWKINLKPDFYRYYGEKKGGEFFINLLW